MNPPIQIKINKWMGRLGNNIIQLVNTIHIAIELGCNILVPEHEFLNTKIITINKKSIQNVLEYTNITDKFEFFYRTKINNNYVNPDIFLKNSKKVKKILRNIFVIKSEDCIKAHQNDLHIHIRGGDNFTDRPHPVYIQPPLKFYTEIINSQKWSKIYIISEDRKNPCVDKLVEMYPKIQIKSSTLINDIKVIIGAFNIVASFGTFISSILRFSNNVKQVFLPSNNTEYYDETII